MENIFFEPLVGFEPTRSINCLDYKSSAIDLYAKVAHFIVGHVGLEPTTSFLSGMLSNQLI